MVEQLTLNQFVLGSSPSRGTNFHPPDKFLRSVREKFQQGGVTNPAMSGTPSEYMY